MRAVSTNHRITGFTLIELIVVIVIMAILAAVALPQLYCAAAGCAHCQTERSARQRGRSDGPGPCDGVGAQWRGRYGRLRRWRNGQQSHLGHRNAMYRSGARKYGFRLPGSGCCRYAGIAFRDGPDDDLHSRRSRNRRRGLHLFRSRWCFNVWRDRRFRRRDLFF